MKSFPFRIRLVAVVITLLTLSVFFLIPKSPQQTNTPTEHLLTESVITEVAPPINEKATAPLIQLTPPAVEPTPHPLLAWDFEFKEINFSRDGGNATPAFFAFTNLSTVDVIITNIEATYGCTTPKLPSLPWVIAPTASGQIDLSLDMDGLSGIAIKTVTVISTAGITELTLKVNISNTLQQSANDPTSRDVSSSSRSVGYGTVTESEAAEFREIVAKHPEHFKGPEMTPEEWETVAAINNFPSDTTPTASEVEVVPAMDSPDVIITDETGAVVTTQASPEPIETTVAAP